MEKTLEKELKARVFMHKVAIVKSVIANKYIQEELEKGGITIALPCLEKNAVEHANKVLTDIITKGGLDEAYEKAWEVVADRIPDNFSIM